ncbi:hypothetical protein D9758_018843 [Tetrapyrgos nigripes]|nr:hypothetical protein D9758_018843 [Tetrapyrgos nigripes]
MKKRMKEGLAIDFQDLMGRFTLDTATEFLFGSSFHTLNVSLPYPRYFSRSIHSPSNMSSSTQAGDDFASAFYEAQEIISNRGRMGDDIWPLFEILGNRTDKHMKVVSGYVEKVVEEALGRKKKAVEEGKEAKRVDEVEEDETLLDHLVKITDDPTVLRDETLNILLAGRDTTAATLTFCIYLLSAHIHVLSKLRAEVEEKIGLKGKLRFEDIKECRYLRAVINETLRLFPIVPFNVRESVNETTWPSPDPNLPPVYIPAGTEISYSVFMMHRRKDLWGPDAEIFDPERFLDERLTRRKDVSIGSTDRRANSCTKKVHTFGDL